MKAASIKEIKDELKNREPKEVFDLCLRLAVFKKENKELLTYLLFESHDERSFIESIKEEIVEDFGNINYRQVYFIKKAVRKILRNIKKYNRYSRNKETAADLLLFFCEQFLKDVPIISRNKVLQNIFNREIVQIRKIISAFHEDLQYDYEIELSKLQELKTFN